MQAGHQFYVVAGGGDSAGSLDNKPVSKGQAGGNSRKLVLPVCKNVGGSGRSDI